MISSLFSKKFLFGRFLHSRRAATAVAMALMFVPMLIAASAAVDFARIASARALMQAAVDGAVEAGTNAYQISESNTEATNAANSTLGGTATQLSKFVTNFTPTTAAFCSQAGTAAQCGGAAYINVTTPSNLYSVCPSSFASASATEYCVVASATATLKNSLFAYIIPSEVLSVTSAGVTSFPASTINGKDVPPSPGFGSAGDKSSVGAYAVPMDGPGGTANYGEMPVANGGCKNASGQIPLLVPPGTATSTQACNYLYIASSTSTGSGGTGGSISVQQNQPIAFTFINYTGANGYSSSGGPQPTTNLVTYSNRSGSSPTYQQYGVHGDTVVTTTITCTQFNSNGVCTNSSSSSSTAYNNNSNPSGTTSTCTTTNSNGYCQVTTQVQTTYQALYGQCPDHTLYGSLDSSSTYGAPQSDSVNVYSTAYELLGDPPTQYTNHPLTPFTSNDILTETILGSTYYVSAVCPNYPLPSAASTSPHTPIGAAVGGTYATKYPGLNIFATWFPVDATNDVAYSDAPSAPAADSSGNALTTGNNDIFPPGISGCIAATSAADNGSTPSGDWWAWSGSNYGQCSTANYTAQPAGYTDCTFLVEPLGTNVPVDINNQALLPDYYNEIQDTNGNVVALDPVYDTPLTGYYIDPLTGAKVYNDAVGPYLPSNGTASSTTITATTTIYGNTTGPAGGSTTALFAGSVYVNSATPGYPFHLVIQTPATSGNGQDHNLPLSTSGHCYNPSLATTLASPPYVYSSGTFTDTGGTYGYLDNGVKEYNGSKVPGYNANGTPLDPIANPQDGAVICDQSSPETYALYWNDLGTYELDDLGYWNAVDSFTCSVPTTGNIGGGPATLSF